MTPFLIAEISNHHFGSMDLAKEMILAAKNSGADAVKGQAFAAEDMQKAGGVMPIGFYKKCALTYRQYEELIKFGDEKGIPVFFTILSVKLHNLARIQRFRKIHATRFETIKASNRRQFDKANTFISMKRLRPEVKDLYHATILYATEYMKDIDVEIYQNIALQYYGRFIGISHHGYRLDDLYELNARFVLPCVEKHFFLGEILTYEGRVYRDCLHSKKPDEFAEMAKRLGK